MKRTFSVNITFDAEVDEHHEPTAIAMATRAILQDLGDKLHDMELNDQVRILEPEIEELRRV